MTVIPPRAFWRKVTCTSPAARPSASATSSRILTASASQKCPSLRKLFKYSFSDFDSRQRSFGAYSIEATYRSGCAVIGQIAASSSLVSSTCQTPGLAIRREHYTTGVTPPVIFTASACWKTSVLCSTCRVLKSAYR